MGYVLAKPQLEWAVPKLATRIWARYVVIASDARDAEDFLKEFSEHVVSESGNGLTEHLFRAYHSGSRSVTWPMLKLFDGQFRGSSVIALLRPLLKRRRLSTTEIMAIVNRATDKLLVNNGGERQWKLPVSEGRDESLPFDFSDSDALAARRDFHGFIAALALVRWGLARSSEASFISHAKNVIRLLVHIVRLPWIRADAEALVHHVYAVIDMSRFAKLAIDWNAFRAHCLEHTPAGELFPESGSESPPPRGLLSEDGPEMPTLPPCNEVRRSKRPRALGRGLPALL